MLMFTISFCLDQLYDIDCFCCYKWLSLVHNIQDGLVCVFDLTTLQEEDALLAVKNSNASVVRPIVMLAVVNSQYFEQTIIGQGWILWIKVRKYFLSHPPRKFILLGLFGGTQSFLACAQYIIFYTCSMFNQEPQPVFNQTKIRELLNV